MNLTTWRSMPNSSTEEVAEQLAARNPPRDWVEHVKIHLNSSRLSHEPVSTSHCTQQRDNRPQLDKNLARGPHKRYEQSDGLFTNHKKAEFAY